MVFKKQIENNTKTIQQIESIIFQFSYTKSTKLKKHKTMQQIESIIFRFSYPKYTKLGKNKTW